MVSPRIIFYWTREGQFTAPLITLRRTENSYWYCFQFEEPFCCLDNRTFCDCWLEPERGGAPWGSSGQVVYFGLVWICNGDKTSMDNICE